MTIPTPEADDELMAARLIKVLSDPTCSAILHHLAEGEATVSDLIAAVGQPPQSRISMHLAHLRWCQLVVNERIGRHVRYRLVDRSVLDLIEGVTPDSVVRRRRP